MTIKKFKKYDALRIFYQKSIGVVAKDGRMAVGPYGCKEQLMNRYAGRLNDGKNIAFNKLRPEIVYFANERTKPENFLRIINEFEETVGFKERTIVSLPQARSKTGALPIIAKMSRWWSGHPVRFSLFLNLLTLSDHMRDKDSIGSFMEKIVTNKLNTKEAGYVNSFFQRGGITGLVTGTIPEARKRNTSAWKNYKWRYGIASHHVNPHHRFKSIVDATFGYKYA